MSTAVHRRLAELGLELPTVSPPQGVYVPALRSGELMLVAGQIPMAGGRPSVCGQVGGAVPVEQARKLSAQCALAALAAIDFAVGLAAFVRVVKVVTYVSCVEGFADLPEVADGASRLLNAVGAESGGHVRSDVGVSRLPFDVPVEVDITAQVATGSMPTTRQHFTAAPPTP